MTARKQKIFFFLLAWIVIGLELLIIDVATPAEWPWRYPMMFVNILVALWLWCALRQRAKGSFLVAMIGLLVVFLNGCGDSTSEARISSTDPTDSGLPRRGSVTDASTVEVGASDSPTVEDAQVEVSSEVSSESVTIDAAPDLSSLEAAIEVPLDLGADLALDLTVPDLVSEVAPAVDACAVSTYLPDQQRGTVVFRDGVAHGVLGGLPWPTWGERDIVTGPVCLPGDYVAGSARSCAKYLSWGSGSALCLSGLVPAVPSAELGSSWGLGVAVPAGCAGEVGQDFTSMSATLSGVPTAAMQAARFHLAVSVVVDGVETLYYVADDGRGVDHDLTTFNTAWWSPSAGTYLKSTQARHVGAAYVFVHSSTATSFTVADMCLTQIRFK